ncbi:TIP49 domain protein, partial [Spraguea lophii 42_110]
MPINKQTIHSQNNNKNTITPQDNDNLLSNVKKLNKIYNIMNNNTYIIYGEKDTGKSAFIQTLENKIYIDSSELMKYYNNTNTYNTNINNTHTNTYNTNINNTHTTNTNTITNIESKIYSELLNIIRSCITITLTEPTTKIIGEVVDISSKLTLRTKDMESIFSIGDKMLEELKNQRITKGDIIAINKYDGTVEKKGRIDMNGIEGIDTQIVEEPEGEIIRNENEIKNITLYEMDIINYNNNNMSGNRGNVMGGNVVNGNNNTMNGNTTYNNINNNITDEIREDVDNRIQDWIEEGNSIIDSKVLIIDNASKEIIEIIRNIKTRYKIKILLFTNDYNSIYDSRDNPSYDSNNNITTINNTTTNITTNNHTTNNNHIYSNTIVL